MSETRNILIVEDEKALSHALKIKLTEEGYTVTIAQDGKEAIDLVNAEHFDLILLDIVMPRMDGYNVLSLLQGAGEGAIPVMVLSNLGQDEEIKKAMALGAIEYLVKANAPFAQILEKVHRILEG